MVKVGVNQKIFIRYVLLLKDQNYVLYIFKVPSESEEVKTTGEREKL